MPPPPPLAREPPPRLEPELDPELLRLAELFRLLEALPRPAVPLDLRALAEVLFRALAEVLLRAVAEVLLRAVLLRAEPALLRALAEVLLRAVPALFRAGLVPVRELGEPAFGRDACWARAGVPRRIARASDLTRSGFRRLEVPVTPRLRSSARNWSTRRSARSASRMLPPARLMIAVAERGPEPRVELELRAELVPELRLDRLWAAGRCLLEVEFRRRVLVC